MTMQKLLSKTRQAINDFNMINDNDKIAVGLSGGKDSVTLLHILKNYQKFSPQKFELIAITLNPGGVDNGPLHELCKKLDVPFCNNVTSKVVPESFLLLHSIVPFNNSTILLLMERPKPLPLFL